MCCTNTKLKTNMDQLSRAKTDDKSKAKKIDKLVICRIPVSLLDFEVGHYWIELIHDDEDKVEHAIAQARVNGLTEAGMIDLNIKCSKPNGYRESYGWFPSQLVVNPINIFHDKLIVSNDGILNGDHENRINKDKDKIISPTDDREAGRRTDNNELSLRPFDSHQNLRFHPGRITTTISPYILPDDKRTTKQIFSDIKETAIKFGENFNYWSWDNDSYRETNCHTLLFIILASCNLADPEFIGENLDKHFTRYRKSLHRNIKKATSQHIERKELMDKLFKLSMMAKTNNDN